MISVMQSNSGLLEFGSSGLAGCLDISKAKES